MRNDASRARFGVPLLSLWLLSGPALVARFAGRFAAGIAQWAVAFLFWRCCFPLRPARLQ